MVYLLNQKTSQRYTSSEEAHELPSDESKILQPTMADNWESVLMKRVVCKMLRIRQARSRSARLNARSQKIRLLLGSVVLPCPSPSGSQDSTVKPRSRVWTRPAWPGKAYPSHV